MICGSVLLMLSLIGLVVLTRAKSKVTVSLMMVPVNSKSGRYGNDIVDQMAVSCDAIHRSITADLHDQLCKVIQVQAFCLRAIMCVTGKMQDNEYVLRMIMQIFRLSIMKIQYSMMRALVVGVSLMLFVA